MRKRHSCKDDPDFANLLRESGLKATQPRLAILDFLFHQHGPFTPDEIFHSVGAKDLDLTTVYRTTSALEKIGMLTRCDFGDGIARYELRGNEEAIEHHHHVICRGCRKITSLEICLADGWKKTLASMGYADPGHALEFFGTCRSCQQGARQNG